jgi:ribonuclease R
VELPNTIEGMVHVTKLNDDYYEFREETYELVGEVTNHAYRLGQKIRIVVTDVNLSNRTIDFNVSPNLIDDAGQNS